MRRESNGCILWCVAGPTNTQEALEHIMVETSIALDDVGVLSPEAIQEQIKQSWDYHMWLAGVEDGPFDG